MLLYSSSRVYVSLNRDSTFKPLSYLSEASYSSVYINGDDLFVSFRKFQSPSAEGIYWYYFQTKMWVNFNNGLSNNNIQIARHNGVDKYYTLHKSDDFVVKLFVTKLNKGEAATDTYRKFNEDNFGKFIDGNFNFICQFE
jgi:hypothetical protein